MRDDSILKFSKRYFTQIERKMLNVPRMMRRVPLSEEVSEELCMLTCEINRDISHLQDRLVNFAWDRLPKKDNGRRPNIYFPASKKPEDFRSKVGGYRLLESDHKCRALIDYLETLQVYSSPGNKFFPIMRDLANQKHTDDTLPEPETRKSITIGEGLGGHMIFINKLEYRDGEIKTLDGSVINATTGKIESPVTASIKYYITLIFREHNVNAIELCTWGINTTRVIAREINRIIAQNDAG